MCCVFYALSLDCIESKGKFPNTYLMDEASVVDEQTVFRLFNTALGSASPFSPHIHIPPSFQPIHFYLLSLFLLSKVIPLHLTNCFVSFFFPHLFFSMLHGYLVIREKRRESLGSRLKSLSSLDDEDVFDKPVAAPRSLSTRSYTIDTPYYSSSTFPETSLKEDEPPAASPATGLASFPTASQEAVDSSACSDTTATITPSSYRSHPRSPSPPAAPQRRSLVQDTGRVETVKTTTTSSLLNSQQRVLEPTNPLLGTQTKAQAPYSHSEYKQPQHQSLMEAKPPAVSRVSASLPRSYQRSDSARLTSVVTPRPFGTQSSRISSLSRALTVSMKTIQLNTSWLGSAEECGEDRMRQIYSLRCLCIFV